MLVSAFMVVGLSMLAPAVLFAAESKPARQAALGTAVFDSLGEMIRSLNTLENMKPTLPAGDESAEVARDQHAIPDRVTIVSPHGGTDIAVFVYKHENAVPLANGKRVAIIGAGQYKYLTSKNNLVGTYLLFEEEPLRIGDQTYAFKKASNGHVAVFFVAADGNVEEAVVAPGQSLFVAGGKFIIKGVSNR